MSRVAPGATAARPSRAGGRAPTRRVDAAAQRHVQAETWQTRQQRSHHRPPDGAVWSTGAGARLVGAVQFVAGVVLEAVVEQGADAAHARHHVDRRTSPP